MDNLKKANQKIVVFLVVLMVFVRWFCFFTKIKNGIHQKQIKKISKKVIFDFFFIIKLIAFICNQWIWTLELWNIRNMTTLCVSYIYYLWIGWFTLLLIFLIWFEFVGTDDTFRRKKFQKDERKKGVFVFCSFLFLITVYWQHDGWIRSFRNFLLYNYIFRYSFLFKTNINW